MRIVVKYVVFSFLLFIGFFMLVNAKNSSFELKLKTSTESHLNNGFISFIDMGINSGPYLWGTSKFLASTDGGTNWFYAYCLNNDLYSPFEILDKDLKDFDETYNYDSLAKILYYGYGGDGWNGTDYEYVRKNSYYIWMPYYDANNTVAYWHENWTDDLAYVLTHLALSYAYYHDVMKLPDAEAEERAFYGVFESEEFTGTKGKSVAKLWYEYLMAKPDIGINIYSENNDLIDVYRSDLNTPIKIKLGENISIKGNDISSPIGGKIDFIVPEGMKCEVTGNQDSASEPGVYTEGERIVLGNGQSFNLSLVEAVDSFDTLKINLSENYNVFRVDGGKDENGIDYQDIAGLYRNTLNNSQVLGVNFKAEGVAKLNINKKVFLNSKPYKNSNIYYFGIFEDNKLVDVLEMKMNKESSSSKIFYLPYDGEKKYVIKETDKDGNPINDSNLKINIDNNEIIFNDENLEASVNITNEYSLVISPNTGNGRIIMFILLFITSLIFIIVLGYKLKKKNKFSY